MVPCLVLNLDRSTDRLADITAQFLRIGMPFERIPAIDGRKPLPDHVRGFLHRGLAKDRVGGIWRRRARM